MYCSQCGTEVPEEARFCASCGKAQGDGPAVATATAPPPQPQIIIQQVNASNVPQQQQLLPVTPKSKLVAVLLAVFLGPFTYLYTYQRDGRRFWTLFIWSILTAGIWFCIAWLIAIIDTASRGSTFYDQFPNVR
jgi:hypothetical protein